MSQKYYETTEFKTLQANWYELIRNPCITDVESLGLDEKEQRVLVGKLRKVENFNHIESIFDIVTYNFNKQVVSVNFEQVRHFEKCSIYLNSGELTDKFDIFILDLYRDGYSTHEIEPLFAAEFKFKRLDQSNIYRRLSKMLKAAGTEPITFNF